MWLGLCEEEEVVGSIWEDKIQRGERMLSEAADNPALPILVAALDTARQRHAVGLAEYGEPLTPETQIDWLAYAVEEAADLSAYLQGLSAHVHGDDKARVQMMREAVAQIWGALERIRLEREGVTFEGC